MPHLSDVRGSKSPFQLAKVLSFVNDIVFSTVGKTRKDALSPWAALSDAISHVTSEASALIPIIVENENVIKSGSFVSELVFYLCCF